MEELDYLQPGFDPNTLTVPKLRNALLAEDVEYPQTAKKAVLVGLFNQHVAPKAERLRNARSNVQGSTRGMTNVGAPVDDVEPTPRRKSSRRPTRGPADTTTEEEEEERSRSRRKSTTRSRATESTTPGFDEPEPPKSIRSTRRSVSRKSIVTPKPKTTSADDDTEDSVDGPVFSSYNPFQSGSSPVSPDRARRKTTGGAGTDRRKSSASRRRTDFGLGVADESYNAPARRFDTVDLNRSSIRNPPRLEPKIEPELRIKQEEVENDLMPGEEFVPEEVEEVAMEDAAGPLTRRRRSGAVARASSTSLWAIVTALLVGYFAWWRKQKIEAGFCGVGGFDMDHGEKDAWVNMLRPECEPCPPHAICMPDLELQCEDDYIEAAHPFSLNGIIPLPPSCQPDTEKERRITVLADEAINVMRERNAEERCKRAFIKGEFELPDGVSQDDLRQVLYDRKSASLSDREFAELWRHAIDDVVQREEVVKQSDGNGTTYLKSNSLAGVSFTCAVRLAVVGSVARYRIEIIGVIVMLITALKIRSSFAQNRAYQVQVTKLVRIALARLARAGENGIAVAHLRDQVLQHEFDPIKRKNLWAGVEKVVEMNSNVRAGEREVMGEIMRVWTWIGGAFLEPVKEEDMEEVIPRAIA